MIRKIEVKDGTIIDSIRFTFGDVKAESHGGTGGNIAPDCIINEGDVITTIRLREADVREKPFVQRLEFQTRNKTVCDFGKKSSFTKTLSHDGYHLSYVTGENVVYHSEIIVVNALKFYWVTD